MHFYLLLADRIPNGPQSMGWFDGKSGSCRLHNIVKDESRQESSSTQQEGCRFAVVAALMGSADGG